MAETVLPVTSRVTPPTSAIPDGGRISRRAALIAVIPASIVAVVVAMAAAGTAAPPLVADPGTLVRWGLPVVTTLLQLAQALAVGAFLLAATVVPPRSNAWIPVRQIGAIAAGAWALLSILQLVMTYSRASGTPIGGPTFGSELWIFVTTIDMGKALSVQLAFVALLTVLAVLITRPRGAGLLLAVSVAALVPQALTGHAAGTEGHETAVSALGIHLIAVGVWAGGLAALAMIARRLGAELPTVVARYSTLAAWAFVGMFISGLAAAWLRFGKLADLLSPYGGLVIAKTVLFGLLGIAGYLHRRTILPQLFALRPAAPTRKVDAAASQIPAGESANYRASKRLFWRLAGIEVVIMGATIGVAAALSSTAPPVPDELPPDPTPAQILTGDALPPPLQASSWILETKLDLLFLIVVGVMIGTYLAGVLKLRRRGDHWPVSRTVLWVIGCLILLWVSNGGPAAYGRVLFSMHMVQHMTLAMFVPIFLVRGAPISLLVRAVPRRADGTTGVREMVLGLVHSRVGTFFAHPIVAAVNFAGSLVLFYFTPWFEFSLRSHIGHVIMMVHFLLAGYLFASALIGVDPGPKRRPYPMRLMLLMATMVFHAFFGITIVGGNELLAADWFGLMGRPWGVSALADQKLGGAIAWGVGEIPTLILALIAAVGWYKSEERTAQRYDRMADRDGDAELKAYNAMLAAQNERD